MNQNNTNNLDEFYLSDIAKILWSSKNILFIILIASIFFSFFLSSKISDTYKSVAILAPSESSDSLTKMSSQYSAIASMAGIPFGGSSDTSKVDQASEIVKSFNFFEEIINKYEIFFQVVAISGWKKDNNELEIDNDVFNSNTKTWASKSDFSYNGRPSNQYAHRKFLKNFNLVIRKDTGIIEMSYIHYSPYIAQFILSKIIHEVNEKTRTDDIKQAELSIGFLENEISKTQLDEVKTELFKLIQKQIQTIMIANSNNEYTFKILSKPSSPEIKIGPDRFLIFLMTAIFNLLIGSAIILYMNKKSLFINKR
jgi:capsular polysaccharide biosynthesis protein